MKLRTPFDWLPKIVQARAFVVLFALTIASMIAEEISGVPLGTDAAPSGIVSFELAGTLPAAQKILASWDATARVYAGLNLGLDFLFIAAYACCIGLGCVLVARRLARQNTAFAFVGIVFAWAIWFAALLDCIENYALLRLLLGSQQAAFAGIAQWCAVPKFMIVGLGILYIVAGTAGAMIVKPKSVTSAA